MKKNGLHRCKILLSDVSLFTFMAHGNSCQPSYATTNSVVLGKSEAPNTTRS